MVAAVSLFAQLQSVCSHRLPARHEPLKLVAFSGLYLLVGKRRALLNYLKERDIERYRSIVKELGLRK